jgi:hypothetical protein
MDKKSLANKKAEKKALAKKYKRGIIPAASCWLCGGDGKWREEEYNKTVLCPLCTMRPETLKAAKQKGLPDWLAKWPKLEARHKGPPFSINPYMIIIHSGEKGEGVAEYLQYPGDYRAVSAHFAWSSKLNGFVQMLPLNHIGWHCGKGIYKGRKRLNFCSIGIELPGPWQKHRPIEEMQKLYDVIRDVRLAIPSIRLIARHADLDPKKTDPGPFCSQDDLKGLGLEVVAKQY